MRKDCPACSLNWRIHNFDWANPVQQYETTETNQLPKLLTEAVRLVEKESQSAGAN